MLVRTMIKVFGSVSCGHYACDANYDTMMRAEAHSDSKGRVFHLLKPENKPKGWVLSDFYIRCPEHAHEGK
jgi:hypothetical protein